MAIYSEFQTLLEPTTLTGLTTKRGDVRHLEGNLKWEGHAIPESQRNWRGKNLLCLYCMEDAVDNTAAGDLTVVVYHDKTTTTGNLTTPIMTLGPFKKEQINLNLEQTGLFFRVELPKTLYNNIQVEIKSTTAFKSGQVRADLEFE